MACLWSCWACDADFPTTVTGLIMSAYFLGLMIGSLICRDIIQTVGRVRAFAAFASIISVCALAHALWVAPVPWGRCCAFYRRCAWAVSSWSPKAGSTGRWKINAAVR